VNVKLLISISYNLSKVFHYNFLVTTRKVEIPKSCLVRDKAVTPPKLALANLVELLAITLDKPTCDLIGNRPSSIIRVNA
jgi:hypothetical protein